MKITELSKFKENVNPFEQDAYHMGTYIGKNCLVMYANHDDKECNYLIVIDIKTGERIRVDLNE
jgi:hypothetical protein